MEAPRHGQTRPTEHIDATKAKNKFRDVLDRVRSGHNVIIDRHGKPEAVVISVEEYENQRTVPTRELGDYYRQMLQRMNSPEGRQRMDEAFAAMGKPGAFSSVMGEIDKETRQPA
jgi:prevent-host-death family protein